MLHNWTSEPVSMVLSSEELTIVDDSSCLGNSLTKGSGTVIEVSTRMLRARAAHYGLKQFWCQPNVSLRQEFGVHCLTACSASFCGCVTKNVC